MPGNVVYKFLIGKTHIYQVELIKRGIVMQIFLKLHNFVVIFRPQSTDRKIDVGLFSGFAFRS